jgi:hypothetical protein
VRHEDLRQSDEGASLQGSTRLRWLNADDAARLRQLSTTDAAWLLHHFFVSGIALEVSLTIRISERKTW